MKSLLKLVLWIVFIIFLTNFFGDDDEEEIGTTTDSVKDRTVVALSTTVSEVTGTAKDMLPGNAIEFVDGAIELVSPEALESAANKLQELADSLQVDSTEVTPDSDVESEEIG